MRPFLPRHRNALLALALVGTGATACSAILGEGAGGAVAGLACPEYGSGNAIGASFVEDAALNAEIGVFVQAAADINSASGKIAGEVRTACLNMGRDLGLSDSDMADENKAGGKVSGPCNAVNKEIGRIIKAQGQVAVTFDPPKCSVNMDIEGECSAACKVEYTPAEIIAECEPGHLYGSCEGTCTGTCEGTCKGECQGECSAKDAEGNCVGECSGTCGGSCSGTCRASCEGSWKAPQCEVAIRPGSVEGDCMASCKARADFKAACQPGKVDVEAGGKAELAKLKGTLSKNLPVLIKAQIRITKHLAADVKAVSNAGASLQGKLRSAGGKALACVSAAVDGVAQASVNINVSVQASASVSGSVGAKGSAKAG